MNVRVDVRLMNTAAVPQYAGLKHDNDHTDARHLAHLLRLNLLPEGYTCANSAQCAICCDDAFCWCARA